MQNLQRRTAIKKPDRPASGPGGGPLRVLIDATSGPAGGSGTTVVAQIEALARRNELLLTVLATGAVAKRLSVACPHVRVHTLPVRPAALRLARGQLATAARARHFDVVYLPGGFALFLSPRPQVLGLQNAWYFDDPARRFRRRHCPPRMRARLAIESMAARTSVRRADRVVSMSRSMLAAAQGDLGALGHSEVIPGAALPLPAAPCPPGDPPYALMVAHDSPHKEWDRVIDAFLSNPELPALRVVGEATPEHARALESRAASRSPGSVVLHGHVSDPAVLAGLYRSAACCVVHSRFEAFGLAAAQALAAAVPVAAADIPAHREVCGDCAVYYDPADPGALARAVLTAMASGPPARAAGSWSWDENAARLAAVLQAVAGRTPAGSR